MPAYRRAFLLTRSPVDAPDGLVAGPVFPGLLIDPQMRVQWAGDASTCAVVVLGLCLPTGPTGEPDSIADALVTALRRGEDEFFAQVETLAGRYVVVFARGGKVKVTSDATAMGSVFYARRGGAVASRPELVERALGGPFLGESSQARHGFPGVLTGYSRTRLLTAGTTIELERPVVRRWWPRRPTLASSAEDAAETVAGQSANALRHALGLGPVRTELTTDARGRATLALLASCEGDRGTFGFHQSEVDPTDHLRAEYIRISGLQHDLVGGDPAELAQRLAWGGQSEPRPPSEGFAPQRDRLILVPSTLALSNLAGRAATELRWHPPVDAESMVTCHRFPSDVDSHFNPRAYAEEWLAFNDFIDTTEFSATSGLIDPYDQFFWEHRLSSWHAAALTQWEPFGEAFCIFNARTTVEALLSVPPPQRENDTVLELMVASLLPALSGVAASGSRHADPS